MKKLITFGDSFTYGEELDDRSSAWPQQLANKLEYSLINYGEPGTSNDSMVRKLIEFLSDPIESENVGLVVIAWSNVGRKEYADEIGTFDIWPGVNGMKYAKNQPWRQELIDYTDKYHSTEWLCQSYINNIILAQSLLESKNIPYLMLDIVANEYYKNLHLVKFTPLTKLVNKETYIGFGKSGMAEWVGKKVKRGPGGHFLDDGHRIVAEKIYNYYEGINI